MATRPQSLDGLSIIWSQLSAALSKRPGSARTSVRFRLKFPGVRFPMTAAACPHMFFRQPLLPRIEFNAPVTVCYPLVATILPVQGKLAIHGPIRPLEADFLLSLFTWTLAHGG